MHAAAEAASGPALNVPAGHEVAALMALLGQNAPAVQSEHADVKEEPPGENLPGAHGYMVPTAWLGPHQWPGGQGTCARFAAHAGQ